MLPPSWVWDLKGDETFWLGAIHLENMHYIHCVCFDFESFIHRSRMKKVIFLQLMKMWSFEKPLQMSPIVKSHCCFLHVLNSVWNKGYTCTIKLRHFHNTVAKIQTFNWDMYQGNWYKKGNSFFQDPLILFQLSNGRII